MSEGGHTDAGFGQLPRELIDRLTKPFARFLGIEAAAGVVLLLFSLAALFLSNSPWAHDTAFVIGALALLGSRIPQSLRVFMLSLAIVDDIGAILVVAIGYSRHVTWGALALGALGVAVVYVMARVGIRGLPLYSLVGGFVWLAVDASGIHATVTGVILGLLAPARRWISDQRLNAILERVVAHPAGDEGSGDTKDRQTLQLAEIAARETLSPLERLEFALHHVGGFCHHAAVGIRQCRCVAVVERSR